MLITRKKTDYSELQKGSPAARIWLYDLMVGLAVVGLFVTLKVHKCMIAEPRSCEWTGTIPERSTMPTQPVLGSQQSDQASAAYYGSTCYDADCCSLDLSASGGDGYMTGFPKWSVCVLSQFKLANLFLLLHVFVAATWPGLCARIPGKAMTLLRFTLVGGRMAVLGRQFLDVFFGLRYVWDGISVFSSALLFPVSMSWHAPLALLQWILLVRPLMEDDLVTLASTVALRMIALQFLSGLFVPTVVIVLLNKYHSCRELSFTSEAAGPSSPTMKSKKGDRRPCCSTGQFDETVAEGACCSSAHNFDSGPSKATGYMEPMHKHVCQPPSPISANNFTTRTPTTNEKPTTAGSNNLESAPAEELKTYEDGSKHATAMNTTLAARALQQRLAELKAARKIPVHFPEVNISTAVKRSSLYKSVTRTTVVSVKVASPGLHFEQHADILLRGVQDHAHCLFQPPTSSVGCCAVPGCVQLLLPIVEHADRAHHTFTTSHTSATQHNIISLLQEVVQQVVPGPAPTVSIWWNDASSANADTGSSARPETMSHTHAAGSSPQVLEFVATVVQTYQTDDEAAGVCQLDVTTTTHGTADLGCGQDVALLSQGRAVRSQHEGLLSDDRTMLGHDMTMGSDDDVAILGHGKTTLGEFSSGDVSEGQTALADATAKGNGLLGMSLFCLAVGQVQEVCLWVDKTALVSKASGELVSIVRVVLGGFAGDVVLDEEVDVDNSEANADCCEIRFKVPAQLTAPTGLQLLVLPVIAQKSPQIFLSCPMLVLTAQAQQELNTAFDTAKADIQRILQTTSNNTDHILHHALPSAADSAEKSDSSEHPSATHQLAWQAAMMPLLGDMYAMLQLCHTACSSTASTAGVVPAPSSLLSELVESVMEYLVRHSMLDCLASLMEAVMGLPVDLLATSESTSTGELLNHQEQQQQQQQDDAAVDVASATTRGRMLPSLSASAVEPVAPAVCTSAAKGFAPASKAETQAGSPAGAVYEHTGLQQRHTHKQLVEIQTMETASDVSICGVGNCSAGVSYSAMSGPAGSGNHGSAGRFGVNEFSTEASTTAARRAWWNPFSWVFKPLVDGLLRVQSEVDRAESLVFTNLREMARWRVALLCSVFGFNSALEGGYEMYRLSRSQVLDSCCMLFYWAVLSLTCAKAARSLSTFNLTHMMSMVLPHFVLLLLPYLADKQLQGGTGVSFFSEQGSSQQPEPACTKFSHWFHGRLKLAMNLVGLTRTMILTVLRVVPHYFVCKMHVNAGITSLYVLSLCAVTAWDVILRYSFLVLHAEGRAKRCS